MDLGTWIQVSGLLDYQVIRLSGYWSIGLSSIKFLGSRVIKYWVVGLQVASYWVQNLVWLGQIWVRVRMSGWTRSIIYGFVLG